jgi:diguanylate cyclase (GGDEF)-like protein
VTSRDVVDPELPLDSTPAVGDPLLAELTAAVAELEALSRFESEGVAERAQQAVTAARELGATEMELRAELVGADMLRRRGKAAEAARIVQAVRRWASDNDSGHLRARSAYLLAAVWQELGDLSAALEHAVEAVNLQDDDAPPALRIDHLARLADCLALNGDDSALDRYDQVLRLARETGDLDRELLILNNWAYSETIAGRFEAALALSEQLQARSAEYGRPVSVGRLDTVARALMGLGRLGDAEAVLLPGLRPEALQASLDGDAGADFLLTVAEVRRRLGRVPAAQEALDECVRRCDEHGLTGIRVRARREQAELHAAVSDFRAAFEEHKLFVAQLIELQSAERDARARALQAMFETTEARRQSRRYRELSLRDALTGLYNRRWVDEQLPRLLAADDEPATAVTVALLDLDHFKRVNDTFSHDVGDQVLRVVAGILESALDSASGGDGSFAARMGGEEFLLVLVGGHAPDTLRLLEGIRRSIAAHPWAELAGTVQVTASIGATGTTAPTAAGPSELLGRADAHLYRAKRRGRDRVVSDL